MNEATLSEIIAELRDGLVGRMFGKIFVLGREQFAVDFRPHDGSYLLISPSPADPRLHFIRRKVSQLNSLDRNPGSFLMGLRKRLTHSVLHEIKKPTGERVVHLRFETSDETGLDKNYSLTVQLTGRSSNAFLLDASGTILDALRDTYGNGQEIGGRYAPPQRKKGLPGPPPEVFPLSGHSRLSDALDDHFIRKQSEQAFHVLSEKARTFVRAKLKKQLRLKQKLESDLKRHGDPKKWKRLGDLMNANISTAKREGNTIRVIDYFDEELAEVSLELDKNVSISEAAEKFYGKYSKSKTAGTEIRKRLADAKILIEKQEKQLNDVESAIKKRDIGYLESTVPVGKTSGKRKKERISDVARHTREFTSSDGFTILVGKKSKDNDYLTFRLARSLDTWLHAADYPGSHVVIRRKSGQDIPQRTLLEAARLAAFYSKAKNESKAAVSYTQKKFVSKPKGAAPGLVSLSGSKTILVEPGVPEFELDHTKNSHS